MSTYWGYRCLDCDEASPCWFNHGDDALANIAKNWPLIEAIRRSDLTDRVEITVFEDWDEPHVFTWLDEHGCHRLILEDEYGRQKTFDGSRLTPE